MEEIWKPIKEYESRYMISSFGAIRSLTRGGIIKPNKNARGYLKVALWNDQMKRRTFTVHRIVATHFIDMPLGKTQINHIDGNKENNSTTNLEWCTSKENNRHAQLSGLNKHGARRKRKVVQLNHDGHIIKVWPSAYEAGKNGFCPNSIASSARRNGSHKGFKWTYYE